MKYLIEYINEYLFPDIKKLPDTESELNSYYHRPEEINLLIGDITIDRFDSDDEWCENRWRRGEFKDPVDALAAYSHACVYDIQTRLRKGCPNHNDTQYLELLRDLSEHKKINSVLYRVIDSRSIIKNHKTLNIGDVLIDKGFCSCSSDPRGIYEYMDAGGNVPYWLFIINPKQSVNYIDVNKTAKQEKSVDYAIKKFANQHEIILLPTTKMTVTDIKDSYLKNTKKIKKIFEVDLIQESI